MYTGTFLGRRNPENLIKALSMLDKENPELSQRIKISFAGKYSESTNERIRSLSDRYEIALLGFVDRNEIINLQTKAGALLLLTVDEQDKNQSEVLTGKIFEYIGANKPILATAPPGPLSN